MLWHSTRWRRYSDPICWHSSVPTSVLFVPCFNGVVMAISDAIRIPITAGDTYRSIVAALPNRTQRNVGRLTSNHGAWSLHPIYTRLPHRKKSSLHRQLYCYGSPATVADLKSVNQKSVTAEVARMNRLGQLCKRDMVWSWTGKRSGRISNLRAPYCGSAADYGLMDCGRAACGVRRHTLARRWIVI